MLLEIMPDQVELILVVEGVGQTDLELHQEMAVQVS
jgi:hypothetical protein